VPRVIAMPANPKQPRIPQGQDVGYASVAHLDRSKNPPNSSLQISPRHR
jgi:hypothetical protein